MRITISTVLSLFSLILYGQSFPESSIKILANQINQQVKGVGIGNGITARGCLSAGRTLVYQYDVPSYWEPPVDIKEKAIANLKTAGIAKTYYLHDINVDFYYFNGNTLIKKVSILSNELSTYHYELGEYLSIKGHLKSKSVNLKLRVPQGWNLKEGDMPNIVKSFTKDGNTYLILIKDNIAFFSRGEISEFLSDVHFVDKFVEESISFMIDPDIIDRSVVTIDTYPTVTYKVKGKMERSGIITPMIMRCWLVFYEDKLVFFQAIGINGDEFRVLEQLYFQITNSVIFPEQYD